MRPDKGLENLVGIGWRRELSGQLLARPETVGFVEVVAESCRDPVARREAIALASVWPVVPHGVKLSLGSAEGVSEDRMRELGRLARDVHAPFVSEHVSFVRAGGREIGHLTDLPRTREAVSVVATNVGKLRSRLPDVPLLLENVARTFAFGDEWHEMSEADFYAEIVSATGCELLLDVGNLYANAVNASEDPRAVLGQFPLERVGMVHVAGGVFEDGFYFDTHAHAVPDAVFELVADVRSVRPGVPVLLERDAELDDAGILAELSRLRRLPKASVALERQPASSSTHERSRVDLLGAQTQLARALTDGHVAESSGPFAPGAIARAKRVLRRKRADDALPLLGHLRARLSPEDALSFGGIDDAPRAPALTAVLDAWRIALGARKRPELREAATEDSLVLRARFANLTSSSRQRAPSPRTLPFVGRERLPSGDVLWVYKSIGKDAPVRVSRGRT